MSRVLAVTLRYPPYVGGGYELLTGDAVVGLRARGHDVRVLSGAGEKLRGDGDVLPWLEPSLDGDDDLFQRSFEASNAERFKLHFLRLANYRATLRAIDATAPELVLFFNLAHLSLAPVLAARHAGVPTLGYVADPWPENHWVRAWRERSHTVGSKPLGLAALTRAWSVFRELVGLGPLLACSDWLRRELVAAGLSGADIEVLYLGLAPEMQRLAKAPAGGLELRRADAPLRVVCTSMLWEGKGQHVLLKAAARARGAGCKVEVVLAGRGDASYQRYLEELAALPELEGAVTFAGFLGREGVSELLRGAHVFALPSLWGEPFGLATVEAMAHGLPVVASDAGASPELVRDGREGWIVSPGDPTAWSRALMRLADDESGRRDAARAARERALNEFTHERFLDGLEAAARAALDRSG